MFLDCTELFSLKKNTVIDGYKPHDSHFSDFLSFFKFVIKVKDYMLLFRFRKFYHICANGALSLGAVGKTNMVVKPKPKIAWRWETFQQWCLTDQHFNKLLTIRVAKVRSNGLLNHHEPIITLWCSQHWKNSSALLK